jgi:SAM-dependent methyltransferase
MRAIYHVTPHQPMQDILEVGGGRSGLTALLYPQSQITNLDFNPEYAQSPCNLQERVRFVCGDATSLPFENEFFDAVTMFDLLEHVPDDKKAVSEALRVLRPGGFLLISSPNENWQFPYYKLMKPICPSEAEIMAEWGHVRRGYTLAELETLINLPCQGYATFINPLTVVGHDIAFSGLSYRRRQLLCKMLSPLTWLGYYLHKPQAIGTETASAWQKMEERKPIKNI